MVHNLIQWCLRKLMLFRMRKKYVNQMIENEISKDWVKECIIQRKQEFRREELIKLQKEKAELELFYKWLKAQK